MIADEMNELAAHPQRFDFMFYCPFASPARDENAKSIKRPLIN